jgi:D-tagatose-1,6-bisphosphate aldolase subunit GatZ/KbaZ
MLERTQTGKARGIYSVCSAHPLVLRAAMQQALKDRSPLLIEATCNQVNQEGGYTGMRPQEFREFVLRLAAFEGFEVQNLVLGGDHLGPNPWQHLPVEEAMTRAEEMVRAYARAGFTKLHLDASMSCLDDTHLLSNETVAERAARLCAAGESEVSGEQASYIIGTEVPIPGGATESLAELQVTSRAAAEETLRVHREIFQSRGLSDAWERVLGLVVQPGVEFNHDSVVDYQPDRAMDLKGMLDSSRVMVFEAHSTDYQRPELYRALVEDGFAILKVGPALTFAMREALFALAALEADLVEEQKRSRLPEVMEEVMLRSPKNWAAHYHGDASQQKLLRRYSYSDRIRYYWNDKAAEKAVSQLMNNLCSNPIPETLLSAWLPQNYAEVREGALQPDTEAMVLRHIRRVLEPYAAACFVV